MSNQDIYYRCVKFLNREAELLDDRKFDEWLSLLDDGISYEAPVRLTRAKGEEKREFSADSYYYIEDKNTLEHKAERLSMDAAWAENPPSRTRRLISNVRIQEDTSNEVRVKSNLLLYRNRGEPSSVDLLAAERIDTLKKIDGELKLGDRRILIDQTDLKTSGLTQFL